MYWMLKIYTVSQLKKDVEQIDIIKIKQALLWVYMCFLQQSPYPKGLCSKNPVDAWIDDNIEHYTYRFFLYILPMIIKFNL